MPVQEENYGSDHIGREINTLSRKIRYACNRLLTESGVSITGEQCRLLGYIRYRSDKGECVYQRDIEREFGVKRSSVASILANLEKNGCIERTAEATDARQRIVRLTEKGISIDDDMRSNISRIEKTISCDMTEEERRLFISLIRRAEQNISSSELIKKAEENI